MRRIRVQRNPQKLAALLTMTVCFARRLSLSMSKHRTSRIYMSVAALAFPAAACSLSCIRHNLRSSSRSVKSTGKPDLGLICWQVANNWNNYSCPIVRPLSHLSFPPRVSRSLGEYGENPNRCRHMNSLRDSLPFPSVCARPPLPPMTSRGAEAASQQKPSLADIAPPVPQPSVPKMHSVGTCCGFYSFLASIVIVVQCSSWQSRCRPVCKK